MYVCVYLKGKEILLILSKQNTQYKTREAVSYSNNLSSFVEWGEDSRPPQLKKVKKVIGSCSHKSYHMYVQLLIISFSLLPSEDLQWQVCMRRLISS